MTPSEPAAVRTTSADTKAAILAAARRLFHAKGYAGASVRAIAADAGVDPALLIRYFGSKEGLFLDAVATDFRFQAFGEGPLEDVGRALVRSLLTETPEVTLDIWRAMVRASDSDRVRERLVAAMEDLFIAPLAPRLAGPHAELRARLVAVQVQGLLDAVALLGDDRIVAAETATLVELYGAAIQVLVDGVTTVDARG